MKLSPLSIWALSFGYAVGWGAFVMPGSSFLPVSGPLGAIAGIALGAVAMAVIGWNYSRMAAYEPGPGGAYQYAERTLGADYGFFVGWFLSLAYMAILWANATAIVLLSRYVFGDILRHGFHYAVAGFDIYLAEALFSSALIVIAGALSIAKEKFAWRIQSVLAVFLLASVAVCFAVAAFGHEGGLSSMAPAFAPKGKPVKEIMHILAMMPWAFVGFEAVSHFSGEKGFPAKRLFRIICFATLAIALVYAMLALLPVLSLPEGYSRWYDYIREFPGLSGVKAMPVFAAVERHMGQAGVALVSAGMFAGIATGIFGAMLVMGRLIQALAAGGIMPRSKWFVKMGPCDRPVNAIIFVTAVSAAIPFFGRTVIGLPVDVSSLGAAIAYCCTSIAAYKRASEKGDRITMATGAVGALMSVGFALLLVVPNYISGTTLSAESYLLLVFWCLLGFIFYRKVYKWDTEQRFGRSPIVWTGIIVLIFFSSLMWVRLAGQNATSETVKHIMSYAAAHHHDAPGVDWRSSQEFKEKEKFVVGEMNRLNSLLLRLDVSQMTLLSLSLIVMFSLYSIQRKREERLEVANAKAEERDRAKSTFLSNMSHDIRTPLNAIIGYTELSKREGVTEAQLKEYFVKIEASSHHLLALINDVLEMSRIEAGKMELEPHPMDLVTTLAEVYDMFATHVKVKNIDFKVDASGTRNCRVMCDKNRLNRVLLNLLSNAFKFTPSGGQVVLSLKELDSPGEGLGRYELHVKDTGIGMSPEFAAHVFDAFERERNSTVSGIQGTGLGMSITKRIVDLMKGTIDVSSEKGKGTEFTVTLTLPLAPADSVTAPGGGADGAKNVPHKALDCSTKRLLLVEDNEINREIASTVLSDMGFKLETAENGQVAVEKMAQAGAGYFDAVLMDVQMPVMNGYEATRAIRAMGIRGLSDIPIIALSANAFESDVKESLAAGMDAHVAKPMKIPVLMETLEKFLVK